MTLNFSKDIFQLQNKIPIIKQKRELAIILIFSLLLFLHFFTFLKGGNYESKDDTIYKGQLGDN
jgi:hypothetical protein